MIIHSRGQAPEGSLAIHKPTLTRGRMPTCSLRILNSLQTFVICRMTVVALVWSGSPSIDVPPELGLLTFLNSRESSLLRLMCRLPRTYLQKLPLHLPRVRKPWEVLVHLPGCTLGNRRVDLERLFSVIELGFSIFRQMPFRFAQALPVERAAVSPHVLAQKTSPCVPVY
jgi:hypothetical protein